MFKGTKKVYYFKEFLTNAFNAKNKQDSRYYLLKVFRYLEVSSKEKIKFRNLKENIQPA